MLHVATLQALAQLRTPLLNDVVVAVTALGSAPVVAIVLYTLYRFGRRDGAILGFVATGFSAFAVTVLKPLIGRPRPEAVPALTDAYLQPHAFPSGHATLAFALAAVLETEVEGSNGYFYGIAAVVAVSRLYLGVHFPGDVLAGAVLGLTAGLIVHRYRDGVLAAVTPSI